MRSLLPVLLCLLFVSCGSTKSADGTPKPNKRDLKGTWQINNIRFVGEEGLYKANLFDVADSPCFKGSEWVFIPNNGTGKFTVNKTNRCAASTHRILWSFYEPGDGTYDFQFKFVDAKNKPLGNSKAGYRTEITNLTPSQMELRVHSTSKGTPFDIVLQFEKVSDEFKL